MNTNRIVNNILGDVPKKDACSMNRNMWDSLTKEQKDRVLMIMEDWGYSRAEAIQYVKEVE